MKEILNVREACDLLQIGKPTLYRRVSSGEIPHFRIGRVLRFHKESIEKWIEQKVFDDTQERKDA